MVLANWPVLLHPDIVAASAPQCFAWRQLACDPAACRTRLKLPIWLLRLPSDAPWLNPVETLWLVNHPHYDADDLDRLTRRLPKFTHRFRPGSPELLGHIGLLPDSFVHLSLTVGGCQCQPNSEYIVPHP